MALPLMADTRWEPDTIFLIFEEDFRFARNDDPEPQLVKARGLQEVVGEENPVDPDVVRTPIGAHNSVALPLVFFCTRLGGLQHSYPYTVEPTATVMMHIAPPQKKTVLYLRT